MIMSNKAAFFTEAKAKPLQVKDAPMPKAGKGEVVVKNAAVAVNPVDWKIQDYGIFLQKYPNVTGEDVAGEVTEVGEGVTHLKKGDRVISHAFSLATNDPAHGGFQLYTLAKAAVTAKIPSNIEYTSAAVLPLALSTAAACLFKKEALALPMPTENPSDTGKSVLIWGGSSSVGAVAIQLAVGAGVKVITTASKHNHDKLKGLGASAAFDYNDPDVVSHIIGAAKGTEFLGVCDCIGSPDSAKAWTPVFKQLGGKYGSVMPGAQGIPEGCEGTSVFALSVAMDDSYVGEAVWLKWVPAALESGALKAVPPPKVIKGGLDSVQQGLEEQKKGVSFTKIVVEL